MNDIFFIEVKNSSPAFINIWHIDKVRGRKFYLSTEGYAITKSKYKHRPLHFFLGFSHYDHIDRNRLNNLDSNFRLASESQNSINRAKQSGIYTSKFKGVRLTRSNTWEARIKQFQIGTFSTEIEAALAYNQKAKELYGEFAYLNPV